MIVGVLAALLAASLIAHVIVAVLHQRTITSILDRVSTAPRLELHQAQPKVNDHVKKWPKPDLENQHYISDLPYMDGDWNDYRGEPDEGEDEPN